MKWASSIIPGSLWAAAAMAETTNTESGGNLKSGTATELQSVSDITHKNNPVDMYRLIRSRIEQEEYDEAAEVFAIATAYGMFDMSRVQDRTAHQAISVLRMNSGAGLPAAETDKYQEAIDALFKTPQRIPELLNRVGMPDYHPAYMIRHGMGAFTGNSGSDGLVPGFDPQKEWREILDGLKQLEE